MKANTSLIAATIFATVTAGISATYLSRTTSAEALVISMQADEGVPHNMVTAMKEDEGVPRNLITAMKADEGVPHNLVTAMTADEGVPLNLVTS